jgi:hypothetical protein
MNLRDLKLNILGRFAQAVVFKRDGEMVDSCDSLVRLQTLMGTSAYDVFPLLGSMRDVLSQHKSAAKPISIPCVEFSHAGRSGVFDFAFHVHPENTDLLVWIWIDQTEIYEYLRKVQQERNILLIEKEDREMGQEIDRWDMAG